MAAAMGRPGRFRHRFRARHESGEDIVRLDFDKDPAENVKEILRHVVLQQGVSKGKKLAYLNSFVKLLHRQGDDRALGLGSIEILACLQIGLLHEAKEVRAAVLRVLRHLLQAEDMLSSFLALHMDYLVMRCLDVCLENEIERMHAIRLIRHINTVAPKEMPRSFVYSIIAIGNDGSNEHDRFVRVCLATLCEIAFRNVDLVGKCGGISTLLWNILDSHQFPRLNESLTCTVMYLMNHPRSRHYIKANTDLETLLAPLTDSQFHLSGETSAEDKQQQLRREELESKAKEERETRFVASKLSLITLMHTWPGLIRLCHPKGSALQSLIGILYLPYIEIRKHILEMISDVFRLSLPVWTDDFASALVSVDPSETKDLWKLSEGFVAEEGYTLLPHCASTRPNLVENHIALLLSAWINAGLLEALIEVVTSSEGPLFNRTIILLGEMLHMANVLLPAECYSHSHCLPVLLSMASSSNISGVQRHRACLAVKHLSEFHGLKKRGLVPNSLFLDQLLQNAGKFTETTNRHWYLRRDRLSEYYYKKLPNDDNTQHAVRDSQVNSTKENFNWDWDLIGSILKWPDDRLRKMEDQIYIRFLRRVVFFFKPTNHLFSHMDLGSDIGHTVCMVACQLVDFLVDVTQEEVVRLMSELLADINHCLNEVAMKHAIPESVFGSQSLHNTLCMYYFLMIGRFSATKTGCVNLEKSGIFQSLMEIMTPSAQDMHVKLAISALDYSKEGSARVVLSKALTATSESCRLYSTKMLRVLLRASTPGFSSWGVELLVTQLYDQSSAVASAALTILDEACDIEANLLQLIKLRPSLLHLGDQGVTLLSRFLSVPTGFRSLRDANFIPSELERWHKTYNARYVNIVEELLYEALTSHEKSNHGAFTRRSIHKGPKKDVFLPVHLYGQLALHEDGMELLKKEPCLQEYFNIIHNQELMEDSDIFKMKEALWAVGHVGSSAYGVSLLEEESMVPELIRLAEECGVFSIRGTAFYVLGLVASTRRGAEVLAEYGWESQCHTRREVWPVLDEKGWISESVGEAVRLADSSNTQRSGRSEGGRLSSVGSTQLSFIKEETVRSEQNGGTDSRRQGGGDSNVGLPKSGKLELVSGDGRVFSAPSESSDAFVGVPRSRTLPNESVDFQRYQSLPARSVSERHVHKRGLPLLQPARPLSQQASSADAGVVTPEAISIRVEGAGSEGDSGQAFHAADTCEVAPSPVIRLRAYSEDEQASPELSSSKGKEPMFRIGSASGSSSSGGQKEDRSSSDSSQRSKGRADSFNTDSTTSGVSSCESGNLPGVAATLSSLSPIPSTSSINTLSTSIPTARSHIAPLSPTGSGDVQDPVHPSTAHRKRWNLTRIPSFHRQSASPALGSLQSLPGSQSNFFTTHRDVLGYATLRNIRRKRTYSADADPDSGNGQGGGGEPRITRTISVESDSSLDSNIWLSIRRNVSSASLTDHDHQGQQLAPNLQTFKPLSLHNRFVGLAMPVDVNMMFEVIEGEDSRSSVFKQKSPEEALAERLSEMKVSVPPHIPPLMEERSFEHCRDTCLQCNRSRQRCFRNGDPARGQEDIPSIDAETESVGRKDSDVDSMVTGQRDGRSRGGSMNEPISSATPGSQTSSTSSDSAGKKLTEDSVGGRKLIRMEILRLITNLSSSVGLKGSEQGLLSLKQRFPSTFKDVCFFSEICAIISSLSFRLNARRFIQELFDDIDITKMVEGPYSFLGITEEDIPRMAPIRQDSMDSFADFS